MGIQDSEVTMRVRGPDGQMSAPFTASDLNRVADEIEKRFKRKRLPMKPDAEFDKAAGAAYSVAADELRQFIERYERLAAEKADLTTDQKEVMAAAKGRGYDTKVIRKIIALRKREPDKVAEEEAVLAIYKAALGMA